MAAGVDTMTNVKFLPGMVRAGQDEGRFFDCLCTLWGFIWLDLELDTSTLFSLLTRMILLTLISMM